MPRSGQCRTCRGHGKVGELRSMMRKGQLQVIEARRDCPTCRGGRRF